MGKRQSIKQGVVSIPATVEEAIESLGKIGNLQRQIVRVNNALEGSVERLKQRATEKIVPREQQIQQLFEGLFIFAQARREELTEHGEKKTIRWPSGEIYWRTTPPAVNINNTERVLAALKAAGLNQFIRSKEEIDKEAILKEKEAIKNIKGITVGKKEIFAAKPAKLEIEISKEIKMPKKQVS